MPCAYVQKCGIPPQLIAGRGELSLDHNDIPARPPELVWTSQGCAVILSVLCISSIEAERGAF